MSTQPRIDTGGGEQDGDEVIYALVCLKTGIILRRVSCDAGSRPALDDLANASPELFNVTPDTDWASLFARFGSEDNREFREIVLVSPQQVRVMERMPEQSDVALVAVAAGVVNVGFVLSGVRRKMLELSDSREATRGSREAP
jgi:hypothetical protein